MSGVYLIIDGNVSIYWQVANNDDRLDIIHICSALVLIFQITIKTVNNRSAVVVVALYFSLVQFINS